ncbi:ABC transporter permease [Microbacterium telephonicum]|uniref:ABC-type nitrate/sulfonate/bicarbonate transport system permease component n=1 Tax=Microbacterium telephonicum TaxID=1714841 RepID=A0A498C973_9MICO|nr:ABC transporter permease subunit [Microbacterium telephonicum]RLK52292.1 ABC-type nitrate/sulfonate/bicarbonate transport system permease component [Microbacterium telephonicum]
MADNDTVDVLQPPAQPTAKIALEADAAALARLRADRRRAVARSFGRSLGNALITIVVLLALWQAVVSFTGISPYVAKGPLDVFAFLFTDEDAAAHRDQLFPLLGQTLVDSVIGFAVGMVVAIVLAVLFSLSKAVEAGVMPLVLLLRTIPLVSIAPVIILITGRGTTASVAVIGTVVVLFPALANVLFGLSRASRQSLDVVHVFGGSRFMALRKVNIPGALPSVFAAMRVSVPSAVTGALLAEWLSTGAGIGGAILKFNAQAQFAQLWGAIALITLITLVLYNIVQILENVVLARMGMAVSIA